MIEGLDANEWEITRVPDVGITAVREWPDGSTDIVFVLSPETTYGRRQDPSKKPVWNFKGSAETVVRAIQELPAPEDGSV